MIGAFRVFAVIAASCAFVGAGCSGGRSDSTGPARARLDARVVLPADTFFGKGPVGAGMDTVINGRRLPLEASPVQGFSSLLVDGEDLVALQDNGLGTLDNSHDSPLRWYRLRPDWRAGTVAVTSTIALSDPGRLLPFPLAGADEMRRARRLSGADLDPESMVAMGDGTYWIGEEFGPSLVHVDRRGVLLEKPVPVPMPAALRAFARGSPFLRTPDHPDLRGYSSDATRRDLANLPRSGGIEGLARSNDGSRLYASIEKGLLEDVDPGRRLILEFDPARHNFTGRWWSYRATTANVSISSLDSDGAGGLLVLERDTGEGRTAAVKRVYRVVPDQVDEGGNLVKVLVCDLLRMDDDLGVTRRERGAIGLGRRFSLPFITPECLLVLDASTIVVANDNNYPFSAGRRPGKPDDNEIVRLRLKTPLYAAGAATVATAPVPSSSATVPR